MTREKGKNDEKTELLNALREIVGPSRLVNQLAENQSSPVKTAQRMARDIFASVPEGALRYPRKQDSRRRSR